MRVESAIDGLFGIEYARGGTKAYRFFALEADRGTMPVGRSNSKQTSYLEKIAVYREIIASKVHKAHWGLPNLLVLTLTTSEARMNDIIARLEGQTGDSAAFLFKAVGASETLAPATHLLSKPWQRAALPPLRIDE